jgi:hypothetical protein
LASCFCLIFASPQAMMSQNLSLRKQPHSVR